MIVSEQSSSRPATYMRDGIPIISIVEERDLAGLDAGEPTRSARPACSRQLVIDVGATGDISNPALVALCATLHQLRARGLTIAIAGLDPRACNVLTLAGLDITLGDTVPDALSALQSR